MCIRRQPLNPKLTTRVMTVAILPTFIAVIPAGHVVAIPTALVGSMPTVVPNPNGIALPTESPVYTPNMVDRLTPFLDTPTGKVSVVNRGGHIGGGGYVSDGYNHRHISSRIPIGLPIFQWNISCRATTIPRDIANITGTNKEKEDNNTLKQKSGFQRSTCLE